MQNTSFKILGMLTCLLWALACDTNNSPQPTPPNTDIYLECVPEIDELTFDIVSWNIQRYAASDFQVNEVVDIILTMEADIIALQEITSISFFEELVSNLPGWEGIFSPTGDLNLAYLYKTSEVSVIGITQLFLGEYGPFPRAAALTTATHVNGTIASLINIHLKCCGGEDNIARRTEASAMLKEYVDTNLPEDKVIILGDFNDIIYSSTTELISFQNFFDDSDNYEFVDYDIAMTPEEWSYPDWPSHIDHILITNELFNQVKIVETLILDNCQSSYLTAVSDHRPLLMSLGK